MFVQRKNFRTEKELREAILEEKLKGTSDIEIGRKFGVTFRYIERVITKSQGVNISAFKGSKRIRTLFSKDFREEKTTVWSFKQRGNWATHSGEYRGNWSPYIPRNIILKYSKPGELVLDYFCGAGTTAVECKLLGRRCIALDINDKAIELARKNVDFKVESTQLTLLDEDHLKIYEPELSVADARDLSFLQDNSIDLICAHPPYANIIHYTNSKKGDLSFLDIDDFLKEMSKVARESFRVLKQGRQCAILIGDIRRKKHVVPLGFKLINVFLDAGFRLRELVIKRQHNCKTTGFWYTNSIRHNFLLSAHEYLPIFEKPEAPVRLIREKSEGYRTIFPVVRRSLSSQDLDKIETTTVWILPKEGFEKHLNENVIKRYSNGEDYITVTFISHCKKEFNSPIEKSKEIKGMIFIKSPFLDNNLSQADIDVYLQEIEEIIKEDFLKKGGFFVIQTRDIRIDGYIEPLAKKIIDSICTEKLWLKEIVVVTQEDYKTQEAKSEKYLTITHQYLLVYEKI